MNKVGCSFEPENGKARTGVGSKLAANDVVAAYRYLCHESRNANLIRGAILGGDVSCFMAFSRVASKRESGVSSVEVMFLKASADDVGIGQREVGSDEADFDDVGDS